MTPPRQSPQELDNTNETWLTKEQRISVLFIPFCLTIQKMSSCLNLKLVVFKTKNGKKNIYMYMCVKGNEINQMECIWKKKQTKYIFLE